MLISRTVHRPDGRTLLVTPELEAGMREMAVDLVVVPCSYIRPREDVIVSSVPRHQTAVDGAGDTAAPDTML